MTEKNTRAGRAFFINSIWAVGARISINSLGAISIIFLARILTPDDYGIVAQAVMIIGVLEMMTALGLETALIVNQKATKEHYDTVWTLHVLQGLMISLCLAALAGPASIYFREPQLEMIIYCYALLSFVEGFDNVGVVDFRKDLKFNLEFRYVLYCKLISFVVTLIAAYYLRSYWALIIGVATNTLTRIILSYVMSPYRPSFCLNKWRDLFHFSKWMMMHEMTTAFTWEVDSFILARFSNARMLGTYVVASELAETPTVELGTSVARAASPSLSKLNDNHDDLKSLYQKSLAMLVLIGAPAGVGINVLAQELSDLVLGDKWQAAIPFIEIIAIVSIFSLFTTISISALISSGRIKVLAFLSLTRLIVRSTILALGFYYFGVYGLVVATLVASIIYIMISLCTQRYYNLISFREIFGLCWRCITSTVIMYFSLLPIQDSLDKLGYGDLFDLVVITLAGIVIYSISLLIIWIVIGKKDGPEKEIVSFLKNR